MDNGPLDAEIGPFLRWAGSKRQLIHKLKPYWNPGFSRYVEPFMGSACLFFAVRPRRSLLSDLNPELVDTFLAVRDYPNEIADRLSQLSRSEDRYYDLRRLDTSNLDMVTMAVRFIYLNRYCFNGLYRTNRMGRFNVPFSRGRTGRLPDRDLLQKASLMLQDVELLCGDFEDIISTRVGSGDFVYMDPPYAVSDRRVFKQYGAKTFGVEDLNRLKKVLHGLDDRGALFVLSYAACREILSGFGKWTVCRVQTTRNVAGFARYRRRDEELVITNIVRPA